jgi:selenocysteine lyase/cysteine desulfurase
MNPLAPPTSLDCQADLFPPLAIKGYLNGASRAPQLKSVAAAARHALNWRENNSSMPIPEFFGPVESVKEQFARLISCQEKQRIALIPAASYGISTVAKNLPLTAGQHILVVEDQFPSNYYAWQRKCQETGAELRVVGRPEEGSSVSWSQKVLEAITPQTAAVAIANIHWADGSLFDLVTIRRRTDEVGAWLVIDGTQSLGALPFSVEEVRPDAVVAGGYKWLMGPYGCGYAYYGERMDEGVPLEENWINRAGSEDFRNLVNYRDDYRPLANRYSVGEHSNFIMTPMQVAALQQVNAWGQENIQQYCARLWEAVVPDLGSMDIILPAKRAHHLVGIRVPNSIDAEKIPEAFTKRGLTVSYRGDAIRVSPHVYNTVRELELLVDALGECRR